MKYYLAAVAVPDDYKPDEELINDVDFYFREGNGYSAIESTNDEEEDYNDVCKQVLEYFGKEILSVKSNQC